MKNFKTKLSLIAIATFFLALMTTERASAQFGLTNPIFDVQYNNQFDDSTDFQNLGYTLFEVDTTAPYGSFVSNYMGAINSFTADNGFALIDLDAQPTANYVQYGELALLETITVEGHDNYGVGFQSYYGAYDGADSVFLKVWKANPNGTGLPIDTMIRLHADLPAGSIEDSIHYIDLSDFVTTGDEITFNFVCYSSWGLAWLIDDLVVLAWNPTQVVSSINDVYNPNRELLTIYNMLGQPVTTMVRGQAYIKVYTDGTREKVALR